LTQLNKLSGLMTWIDAIQVVVMFVK